MWQIRLVLNGGMTHLLPDVRGNNPGWNSCQPSGLLGLDFSFLGRDDHGKDIEYFLQMRGMREYNFFVEAMMGFNGKKKIQGLWFLGKLPDVPRVTGWVLKDMILRLNAPEGQEYSGMPTVGWKSGMIGDKVISEVRRTS